jgi:nucleoside-diphosphate-sugar epimerase
MFKELFVESNKRLVFTVTDSSYYGGHLQQMMDGMKLSYPIQEDNPFTWVSNPLPPAHLKILKKEIESQLSPDLKKDKKAYKFTERS